MEKNIVYIGGIDWYGKYKYSTHHIVGKLSENNRVFYIDNFGGRRDLRLRDASRILRRIAGSFGRREGSGRRPLGGHSYPVIVQPVLVPTPRLPDAIGRMNSALLARALNRIIDRYNLRDIVMWTCVPTDVVWDSISRVPHRVLVYQCVDKFSGHPLIPDSVRSRFSAYEEMFTRSSDLVYANARGLFEEKKKLNPKTYFFPNGVDPERFRGRGEKIEFLENMQQPIVGFAGLLGPWVDFELLKQCASIKTDWSFVLLGSVSPGTDTKGLTRLPNVHLTGAVDHSALGDYFRYFDVGLIPYLLTGFTQYTFPSKLAEYLAAGLPAVATPLPEVEPYSNVVSTAAGPEEMVEAIRKALEETGRSERIKTRLEVARSMSWNTIVSQMEQLINDTLQAKT
ncbi:MAG: glycosyltransferase [Candidatus Latescibacteria bacterium]|nr:glycosyltransferase [Candidatus Latescibacterota bacterium]NIM21129.1 glycosyltransferase [Candidatus Latescibacterota bacterium]NIM65264.1 glycosyltransferase [Candidatus Latescibacterota bacterium]NIO01779.1 glycosyltransferase [Candidatus Latescibacterota bacterium]NIO28296.1 glycosyltransferase [Candidatus Latescibacterota bacterium]